MFLRLRDIMATLHSIGHNIKKNMDFMGDIVWTFCIAILDGISIIFAYIDFMGGRLNCIGAAIGLTIITVYGLYLSKKDYNAVI